MRLYKNGRLIGGRTEGGSCFGGLVDELSVYRRALSPEEIARLAQEGKPED